MKIFTHIIKELGWISFYLYCLFYLNLETWIGIACWIGIIYSLGSLISGLLTTEKTLSKK